MNISRLVIGAGVALALSACAKTESVWIAGWKETSYLSIARAGAAVISHNDVIYMIGGVDGHDFLRTMEFARIQKDGSLSAWQSGPDMNEARGFFEGVVHNGWVYVAGGGNGPNGHNLLRSVERAKIQPDGTLSPWITENSAMNIPRRCSKVLAINANLYSFGGFGGALLDTVEHAAFNPDGSLGPWQMEPQAMTMPRYVNGVKAMGSDAYVIGGHDQSRGVGVTDVEWSRTGADGGFDKWRPAPPLAIGRYGLSTVGYDKYLYALGGITGAEYVDSIERSERGSNGELKEWSVTTPLESPLASFSAIVVRDRLYVLGGTNRDGYSRAVLYATFNAKGDIGYRGNPADQQARHQRLADRAARKNDLPNAGIVREVLQTSAYTYALVENENGAAWLAGPKTELVVGARIRYSQGVYMTNFFSKELQRGFDEVTFVGSIVTEQ